MSVDTRASVGSTLDRIDQLLGELVVTSPAALRMASCGRQADELAVVVERLAGEERAAGGRARTLTALDMLGQALGELAAQLRVGEEALRVLEVLGRRAARGSDRIAVDSGVPIHRARAVLLELELTGLAQRCVDGWRQCGHSETGVAS
jgi:hypothetical protein